jgi:hypothetical protein
MVNESLIEAALVQLRQELKRVEAAILALERVEERATTTGKPQPKVKHDAASGVGSRRKWSSHRVSKD